MSSQKENPNLIAQLRYGKIKTSFMHHTVIAEGQVGDLVEGFECRQGPAFMAMKTWSNSADEAAEMIQNIGSQIGFSVTGQIEIFDTPPVKAPGEQPFGYDIKFTPFNED
jgi:hypothetical protein